MTEENDQFVKEFMESDTIKVFFPNQKITYFNFNKMDVVIQTVPEEYLPEPGTELKASNELLLIEYKVIVNHKEIIETGPEEKDYHLKEIDEKNPFLLSIDSNGKLDDVLESEYLENFKQVFLKLLEISIDKIDKEKILKEKV